MASITTPISQSQFLFKKPAEIGVLLKASQSQFFAKPIPSFSQRRPCKKLLARNSSRVVVLAAATAKGGFAEEMRVEAMKLHTRDQAKEGEKKEPQHQFPVAKWEPTIEGYLKFLVNNKLVYETLEKIVEKSCFPEYVEFRNTGLERSEGLAKDLEWFEETLGHGSIPEPSTLGVEYAKYLDELSRKNPQTFICHFYTVYFGQTAGGRIIGRKAAEKLLNNTELEFYKWDGDLPQLLHNVRDRLSKVGESWSREEKNRCLEEIENAFKCFGDIMYLMLS